MEDSKAKSGDCISCRIVGTGTFATVGGYALWQSRAVSPGTPMQKRVMAGVGVGECSMCFFEEQVPYNIQAC
ncbi:hypothetical protein C8R41DRAFT_751910 [Lentinula lateritia]|uniref:Distal membrane-arm assembly complex protein 1-like domain-containing protein n=1 Tax=Lentinula lateritia TaxID=40482 RepID=A0ABQ8VVB2_9AGAR|nr:hypothetical protein C8R41DRAFT_751910 [Lentinula lateritia]